MSNGQMLLVFNWQNAEYESALYNSDANQVHALLSAAINSAECDSDLLNQRVGGLAEGSNGRVGSLTMGREKWYGQWHGQQ